MRARDTLTLLMVMVAAVGCGRHRYDPLYNPQRLARFEQHLVGIAARDSGCSPVTVVPARVGETVWVANTCTGPREYFLACHQRGRRWANCSWDRIATVNEAAAPVLACPPNAIGAQITASPLTRFAAGCGRQAQMSLRCNAVGCGWMPDGPPQGAAPPPAAAPAYGAPPVVYVPAPEP